MRPDHTIADYVSPIDALPVSAPAISDDSPRTTQNLLTRMTFCFAWLFGLEPFLAANSTMTSSRADIDRRF
jgi:hypothetical protein